jgi:hypothetical protein
MYWTPIILDLIDENEIEIADIFKNFWDAEEGIFDKRK